MPLPVTFATLAAGNQNASLFDTQFAAVGALTIIPCTASGQNAVLLTPKANTPTVASYTDLTPVFAWKQAQTTTSTVTIQVTGLTAIMAYGSGGGVALGSGDLAAGNSYQASYLSSLNAGAGGFVVNSFSAVTTQSTWVPTVQGDGLAGTPTYGTQIGSYEQIGRQVTARFIMISTALTGCTGNLLLAGLPVACGTVPGNCDMSYVNGWTPGSTYSVLGGVIDAATAYIKLIDWGPGVAVRQSPVTDFAAATTLRGFVNYSV